MIPYAPTYTWDDSLPYTLDDIARVLRKMGIEAKVSELPPYTVVVETNEAEEKVREILHYRWPLGTALVVRKPEATVCHCFGPPLSDCPVHGKL